MKIVYDDNGKEFKDYRTNGSVIKKKSSTKKILLIISIIVVSLIIFGGLFKLYLNHHNKILEERKRIELEDSKLENDRNLEALISQRKLEINEGQKK